MSRAVITLTRPPDNRRNTTKARRWSSVSPNAIYRCWRVRLTLWSPAKTSSTSSGVNLCLSIWKMLSSSHSKPEMTTPLSYHVVYTKRYDPRRHQASAPRQNSVICRGSGFPVRRGLRSSNTRLPPSSREMTFSWAMAAARSTSVAQFCSTTLTKRSSRANPWSFSVSPTLAASSDRCSTEMDSS